METEQRNNTQTQEDMQERLVLGRVEYVEDRTRNKEIPQNFTERLVLGRVEYVGDRTRNKEIPSNIYSFNYGLFILEAKSTR